MTETLRIALAQLNPIVGDIGGNADKVRETRAKASALGADLIVFPELFITGYPPEDLVLKPAFQAEARAAIDALAKETADGGPGLLLGLPWAEENDLYNAVALLDEGEIKGRVFKYELPNYGVFDEVRVFTSGGLQGPMTFRGVRLGVPVCEDIWYPEVCECLAETGAELLLVPNGSPFELDKWDVRLAHAVSRVKETGLPLAYVNQIGGQDELVFDGNSFVVNGDYRLAHQIPAWTEELRITQWTKTDGRWECAIGERAPDSDRGENIYQAMVLGVRDYVRKNRFPGVLIGLSGGVDSALTAAISVDALGADKVHCVMMPSRYTSKESLEDAQDCAKRLGVKLDSVPIEDAVKAFDGMMAPLFAGRAPDTTEENIQSRIRGVILMAISNKFGSMVVTTGNKSEMSVGYATLYGDMNGGYNPVKDLYKTEVFAACRWRNAHAPQGVLGPAGEVIPVRIIEKPPSAELREDQLDEDSLPPYPVLDDILECLVEKEMSFADMVSRGHPAETVKRIEHLLYIAEYKRRQAPPGVKLTRKNFGRDRRYPITNGFRDAR